MEETIKEFLVKLGFEVDDSSLSKFNKALATATIRVTALYTSIQALSAGVLYSMSKISEGFEEMGYEFRLIAPAINKTLYLRQELLKSYRATGTNILQVVRNAVLFNLSMTKTKYAIEAIYKSTAAKFFPLLTKQLDIFRQKLYANMPRILSGLEKFVKVLFTAFDVTVQLGMRVWSILSRVYDFFAKLHDATDGWSTVILGVIAAWRLLNLSFLATPLGMLLAGFVALIHLWDDFKTFQEGGESLIDWGSETTKMILGIVGAITALGTAIGTILLALKAWGLAQTILNAILLLNPIGLWITGITALIALLTALAAKLGYLKGMGNFFSGFGGKIMEFAGGNAATNLQTATAPNFGTQPIGSNINNNSSNQNVNQQTSIIVQGSSDANSVGKSIANEQGKVNFDLIRNLRGAAR